MRIATLVLHFEDGKRAVSGYTTPGWYISATDADADGMLPAIEDTKITPDAAIAIAQTFNPRAVAGVEAQNRHAHDAAREAKRIAEVTAAKAAERAAELADWESEVSGEGGDDA